ncbi:kelch-like protein 25 [Arctopsyche grandis]|uniref:kelch-like protein 25 n=1 Tax=Arctopsyche grandis TaxID=121162 RepID=UPI00406D6AA8
MFVVKPKADFSAKRVEYLYDAMKQNKTCDTRFTVRDRNFPAHLIVLMACSEFFGPNEGLVEGIFSDYDFEVIEAILKFCYTGEIRIAKHHVKKLMELANRLKVHIPRHFKTVNLSNCLEVLKFSVDSKSIKKAMDLTMENFEELHKTQDFLNLPASTVTEIFKSDDLIIPSEEDVFNAVKLWLNHSGANRKNELVQLMSSVRLSLLPTEFLVYEVMSFCNLCVECMTSIRQAIKDKDNKFSTQRETMANIIDIFDGLKKSWTLSKHVGINKIRFASVHIGDWIIIIGGKNSSDETVTSVEYIDLKNGELHQLKSLNQPRFDFSATTLRRDSSTDVYAIGGGDVNFENLSSVERWNSKTGDWEIITPLLVAVIFHSASVIDEKIFVTGGRISENGKLISTNKVQMYSVETNSWTYRAKMSHERLRHSSVAFKGKLLVAGGYNELTCTNLDSVERYDPIADVWTVFTKLPKPVREFGLFCFSNKLLSMAGTDGRDLNDVWEYDETSKSWKASYNLSRHRCLAVAHVIPYDSII